MAHEVPFQRSASTLEVSSGGPFGAVSDSPTATQAVADVQDTPEELHLPLPGLSHRQHGPPAAIPAFGEPDGVAAPVLVPDHRAGRRCRAGDRGDVGDTGPDRAGRALDAPARRPA